MQKAYKKYAPAFLIPTAAAFAVAFVIPFMLGLYLSFCEFSTVSDASFVGLKNYLAVLSKSDFLNSLFFTVKFCLVSVILVNVLAFLLALLLTKGLKGTNFFRTVFFMPNLIGGIVLGYIWQLIINGVLYKFGYSVTSNPAFGYWGLIILMSWQWIGYMMVIYIAALQNVPPVLIEAAMVDGANSKAVLRHITLPSIRPAFTICLFLSITNGFKLFDQNLALTAGAPAGRTEMLALNIFNTFYGRTGAEGMGQAKAVIFSVIVAAIALLQLYLTNKKEFDG